MNTERDLLEVIPKVDRRIIDETLCRIGIANKKERILYPTCYLHQINEKFYLVHFKQMFILTRDNSYNNISRDDLSRRNSIAFCLANWKMISVNDIDIIDRDKFVFILPHQFKYDWTISHKFNINSLPKDELCQSKIE